MSESYNTRTDQGGSREDAINLDASPDMNVHHDFLAESHPDESLDEIDLLTLGHDDSDITVPIPKASGGIDPFREASMRKDLNQSMCQPSRLFSHARRGLIAQTEKDKEMHAIEIEKEGQEDIEMSSPLLPSRSHSQPPKGIVGKLMNRIEESTFKDMLTSSTAWTFPRKTLMHNMKPQAKPSGSVSRLSALVRDS